MTTPGPAAGGSGRSIRQEWTRFRTARGWVAGLAGTALLLVATGVLTAVTGGATCGDGKTEVACPAPPLGPEGGAVDDMFVFAYRTLTGDGAITARLTGMNGIITYPPPDHDEIVPGLVPWAKAGVMVKAGADPGASYAALMLTGKHGVRLQHDFVHDTAGRPGGVSAATPRWLRLVRTGPTITGYESTDGATWTRTGTVRPANLPATVLVGLFVTSPGDLTVKPGAFSQVRFTQATGIFDNLTVTGATGPPRHEKIGDNGMTNDWERYHRRPGVRESAGTYTVTGSGDIAPRTDGRRIENTLIGLIPALILTIIATTRLITSRYRQNLPHPTLPTTAHQSRTLPTQALPTSHRTQVPSTPDRTRLPTTEQRTRIPTTPHRIRVRAAQTAVLAAVTFTVTLAATAVTVPVAVHLLRTGGTTVLPVPAPTVLRMILGTAAVLALAATLTAALAHLYRRTTPTVTTALTLLVLPYILTIFLPATSARLLLTLTPAAGLAIQQTIPEYPQVTADYSPASGYFPLPPWLGLSVLATWTAVTFVVAALMPDREAPEVNTTTVD